MNYSRLESRVCLDEGFRSDAYLDTAGIPTIGYGTTRILDVPVTLTNPIITESVARQLLRQDLYGACIDAQALFTRFDEINDVRQEVLVNLAYNLGKTRLSGFTKLLAAAELLDYAQMAAEMENSRWFAQVGQRGIRLRDAMLIGAWS